MSEVLGKGGAPTRQNASSDTYRAPGEKRTRDTRRHARKRPKGSNSTTITATPSESTHILSERKPVTKPHQMKEIAAMKRKDTRRNDREQSIVQHFASEQVQTKYIAKTTADNRAASQRHAELPAGPPPRNPGSKVTGARSYSNSAFRRRRSARGQRAPESARVKPGRRAQARRPEENARKTQENEI